MKSEEFCNYVSDLTCNLSRNTSIANIGQSVEGIVFFLQNSLYMFYTVIIVNLSSDNVKHKRLRGIEIKSLIKKAENFTTKISKTFFLRTQIQS